MRIQRRHWVASVVVAAGVHAALLLGIGLGAPTPIGSGGGVRIALGDSLGPPEEIGRGAESEEAADRTETEAPTSAPPEPPAPAEPEESPTSEPEPEPEVSAPAEPEPPAPPPEPVARAPAEPEPEPAPQTPVAEPEPPAQPEVAQPSPAPPDAAAEAGDSARPEASEGASSSSVVAAAPTDAGGPGERAAGDRGLEGLDPEYVRRFMERLERHKQYPRAARTHRLEGRALLWLRMDRDGRVLSYQVEESTGHRLLDRAVLRAIERASPMPPLPSSFTRAELEIVIPIDFELR